MIARDELTTIPAPSAVWPAFTLASDIAALRTDARHQQRHLGDQRSYSGQFARIGRANDQSDLSVAIPVACEPCHALVQPLAFHRQHLQVITAGVAGSAQKENAAIAVSEIRFDRIETEIRRQRHRMCVVTIKNFACIVLCGRRHIAALRVENDRNRRLAAPECS